MYITHTSGLQHREASTKSPEFRVYKARSLNYMRRNMPSMTRASIQHVQAAPLHVPLQYVSHIRVQREVVAIKKGHLRPRPLASKFLSQTKMTLCHQERPLQSNLGLFPVVKCCPGRPLQAAMICGSSLSYLLGLLVVHVMMTSGIIGYGGCHHAHVRWHLIVGN